MKIKVALGILCMAFLNMCSMPSAILEAKYIQHLQVRESHEAAGTVLHISGLCGHSSYVIKNVEAERRDNILILDIHIAPAEDALLQKGLTGNFSSAVPLPEGVEKVLLGADRTEIWPHLQKGEEAKPPAIP